MKGRTMLLQNLVIRENGWVNHIKTSPCACIPCENEGAIALKLGDPRWSRREGSSSKQILHLHSLTRERHQRQEELQAGRQQACMAWDGMGCWGRQNLSTQEPFETG